MSKFIWKIQALTYKRIRQNPLSRFFLNKEHKGILSLLDYLNINDKENSNQINSLLDLGTGRGDILSLLQKNKALSSNTDIVAVDNCDKMLYYAKKDFPNIKFIQADVLNLPFKDSEFDLIFCVGLTEYIKKENLLLFLKNLKKILKKNGYIIITISTPNILNKFRYLLGHKIYLINDLEFEDKVFDDKGISNNSFKIEKKISTSLQVQYLISHIQKMNN